MDCRKSLVLALGLAGAVGCVPQNSVQPPPAAPRAVTEKAKDPPKHPPTAPTCVAGANYYATSGDEAPPRSALQEHLYDQARRGYQQAIDIDPTCVAAYKGLAHLCAQMSDHEGAVKWYRKGLEKQPKDASLWLEFGVCQARHKEWEPAIDALQHAVELDPDNKQYQNQLGYFLAAAGRPDEATDVLRKSIGETRAHYNVARVLHCIHKDAEARQHLQASLKSDPQFEPAQHLLAQLEGREAADPAVMQAGFELPAEGATPQR
jgi:Tfp pilus assembly protein PilF